MAKVKTQSDRGQRWLSFSAFTLAGVAMEGSQPDVVTPSRQVPKAKRWRTVQ
ncbi:hypothetical protein [Pantoea wallisii]|uniref:hypothetical protein n=1 Tax=Pantoea wallisii TaxID=1076551 RepID=UPI00142D21FA|nr:hypothetical protein [Pantoea wallisii]